MNAGGQTTAKKQTRKERTDFALLGENEDGVQTQGTRDKQKLGVIPSGRRKSRFVIFLS